MGIKGCIIIFLTIPIFFLFSTSSFGSDIQLTLSHQSTNNNVLVEVGNKSAEGVKIETVSVEVNKKKYQHSFRSILPSNTKKSFTFKINYPLLPGSYPLIATVRYYNAGTILSLKHAAMFYYIKPADLDTTCFIKNAAVKEEGEVIVKSDKAHLIKLILPDEVEITSVSTLPEKRIFHIKTKVKGFRSRYTIFAATEDVFNNMHYSSLCQGTLEIGSGKTTSGKRGKLPSSLLLGLTLFFLLLSWYLLFLNKHESKVLTALTKFTNRMFYITFAYYFLKNAGGFLDFILPFINWYPAQYFVSEARNNFLGANYNYFFEFFADYYWVTCLLFAFPYLYWFDSDKPLKEDKYFCSLKTLFSIFRIFSGKKPFWNYSSRLGLLTIGVKFFYIPYLISWVINNTFHQNNLIASFHWDIYTINTFLVALFIYMDTIIYSFGYVVESKYLKNEIKSVEPTILGWVVCLWCYPPFNVFSFRLFDYQFVNIAHEYSLWVNVAMTCLISVLWGVFVWASAALGFKASNLTNRGIVSAGPYRYIRHPAYVAKLFIWIIQGVFFSRFGVGILFGFILIYFLRAWTEERHLSADHAYIEYKKKVPWRFIPKVF